MYLVSAYFDDKANRQMEYYIEQIVKKSGNTYMKDRKVPPHMTISGFECSEPNRAIQSLEKRVPLIKQGKIQWVSVGMFLPYVLYLSPVLNEYLHNLSVQVYQSISTLDEVSVSRYYRPFQWMPHTTVGKKLSKEEMSAGLQVMQKHFAPFSGKIVKIGVAKTNPYQDLAMIYLDCF